MPVAGRFQVVASAADLKFPGALPNPKLALICSVLVGATIDTTPMRRAHPAGDPCPLRQVLQIDTAHPSPAEGRTEAADCGNSAAAGARVTEG
jgi:hypothetical protein